MIRFGPIHGLRPYYNASDLTDRLADRHPVRGLGWPTLSTANHSTLWAAHPFALFAKGWELECEHCPAESNKDDIRQPRT